MSILKEILIATLGTESQVVTLSLLELERLGFNIKEVVVVRTGSNLELIRESLERLDKAFQTDVRLQKYAYSHELIQGQRGPLKDITTAQEAEQTFDKLFQVVKRYKLENYRVHLNVAGGRKPMSIYGMVTAQILFDDEDRLWHLVSDEKLVKSRRLFPEPGDTYSLVPIPVIRWSDRPPLDTSVGRARTPQEALREQETERRDLRYELFLKGHLTLDERAIVTLLAQGLSNAEIATQRKVRKNTIEKQVSTIYSKWQTFWERETGQPPRRQLVAELSAYFERQKSD